MIGVELNLAALAAKIVGAALVVVTASRLTERAGPVLGSLVATLPVSTGPVYVFLAMDHGAAFIADCARVSVASSIAMLAFIWGHAFASRRFATVGSLLAATLGWFAGAFLLQLRDWSFAEACALYAAGFVLSIAGLRQFTQVPQAPPAPRARFDLALRVALVGAVVVATTIASRVSGPSVTGIIATYPVVFTSLIVILQPRWGGAVVAAVLVNGLKGLLGFGLALAVLHLAALHLSSAPALLLALLVAVGWNLGLLFHSRRRRPATE
jgi:hypothetical protein